MPTIITPYTPRPTMRTFFSTSTIIKAINYIVEKQQTTWVYDQRTFIYARYDLPQVLSLVGFPPHGGCPKRWPFVDGAWKRSNSFSKGNMKEGKSKLWILHACIVAVWKECLLIGITSSCRIWYRAQLTGRMISIGVNFGSYSKTFALHGYRKSNWLKMCEV